MLVLDHKVPSASWHYDNFTLLPPLLQAGLTWGKHKHKLFMATTHTVSFSAVTRWWEFSAAKGKAPTVVYKLYQSGIKTCIYMEMIWVVPLKCPMCNNERGKCKCVSYSFICKTSKWRIHPTLHKVQDKSSRRKKKVNLQHSENVKQNGTKRGFFKMPAAAGGAERGEWHVLNMQLRQIPLLFCCFCFLFIYSGSHQQLSLSVF